jgi:predicted dithiol-disulfide oxidoreductase (DUF899 family)
MARHRVGTQEEWKAEREALLEEEKQLTRREDELTQKRRDLPWVPVEQDYTFQTGEGEKSLADLFDGRSQLLIYHFMFGPEWSAGCPVCSSIADSIAPNAAHLMARDTTPVLSSRAPVEKLHAYRDRMGWPIEWVSAETDFHRDLGFYNTQEELKSFLEGEVPATVTQNAEMCGVDAGGYVAEGPGMSVYALEDGTVYRTYVTTSRGLERPAMAFYGLLDRTPKGRDESGSEPHWIRRHDEY